MTPATQHKICDRCKQHGFTFVELLVGLTIFIIVVAAVAAAASAGLKVYQEARSYRVDEMKLMIALEKFEQRVRSTESSTVIPFEGTDNTLKFAGQNSFLDDKTGRLTTLPARLGYRFSKDGFYADADPYALAVGEDIKAESSESRRIAENVSGTFRYYVYEEENDRYIWTGAWDDPETLPMAVELTLYFQDDEDVETAFARRIVSIPAALPQLEFVETED
jgi:Tfp pilus assembly protein PilE